MGRGAVDVLDCPSQHAPRKPARVVDPYHAERPKDTIVKEQPGLLAEASQDLTLDDALQSGKGGQDVFHGAGAQACEEDDAESDEVGVVETNAVFFRLMVVVGEVEELAGVCPCFRDESVG